MEERKPFNNAFEDVGFCAVYNAAAFTANSRTSDAGVYAMRAIRAIAKAGGTMPAELVTWIDEACSAWDSQKGSKGRVRSIKAKEAHELAIARMAASREATGITVEEAAELTNKSYPHSAVTTLCDLWKKGEMVKAKKKVDAF